MSPNRKRSRSFDAAVSSPDDAPDPFTLFRARLLAGEYEAIVGRPLRRALRGAAALPALEPEAAAVRLAMVRLLTEEEDPSRLAAGVARLGAAALQIARLRQPANSELDEIRAHLYREIDAIETELEAERASLAAAQAANQGAPTPAIPAGG